MTIQNAILDVFRAAHANGEVLTNKELRSRVASYSRDYNIHERRMREILRGMRDKKEFPLPLLADYRGYWMSGKASEIMDYMRELKEKRRELDLLLRSVGESALTLGVLPL